MDNQVNKWVEKIVKRKLNNTEKQEVNEAFAKAHEGEISWVLFEDKDINFYLRGERRGTVYADVHSVACGITNLQDRINHTAFEYSSKVWRELSLSQGKDLFEVGNIIWVRNNHNDNWTAQEFVTKADNLYYCRHTGGGIAKSLTGWELAIRRPVKPTEKEKEPFSISSFPAGEVWIKRKGLETERRYLVISVCVEGVYVRENSFISWNLLKRDYEMSVGDTSVWFGAYL